MTEMENIAIKYIKKLELENETLKKSNSNLSNTINELKEELQELKKDYKAYREGVKAMERDFKDTEEFKKNIKLNMPESTSNYITQWFDEILQVSNKDVVTPINTLWYNFQHWLMVYRPLNYGVDKIDKNDFKKYLVYWQIKCEYGWTEINHTKRHPRFNLIIKIND